LRVVVVRNCPRRVALPDVSIPSRFLWACPFFPCSEEPVSLGGLSSHTWLKPNVGLGVRMIILPFLPLPFSLQFSPLAFMMRGPGRCEAVRHFDELPPRVRALLSVDGSPCVYVRDFLIASLPQTPRPQNQTSCIFPPLLHFCTFPPSS